MKTRWFCGLGLLLGWHIQAQQVHVRGKVTDGTGKAIANAMTELVKLKLKDTTDSDGMFSLQSTSTAVGGNPNGHRSEAPSFRNGFLDLAVGRESKVTVEIFNAQGNGLHRESFRDKSGGSTRIDLRDKMIPNQLSIVKVTGDGQSHTFPFLPMTLDQGSHRWNDGLAPSSTRAEIRLEKRAAVVDSLKVSASGFAGQSIPLTTYDTTVNVTLTTSAGKSSPGCGTSSPLKTGTFTESINGVSRKWMIDVPSNYDGSKPYRLIFAWHPLGGSGSQIVNGGFNGLKSLSGGSAIFATADGTQGTSSSGTSGNGWWNANGADMKLFQAMLDKINAGLCVDQDRIFSTGFSFGGMMSYTLPFEFNVFRAVAPCAGKTGIIPYTAKFSNPVAIMAFHGDADNVVEIELGKAFFDKFAARNQCGTTTKAVSPTGCQQYDGCTVPSTWCVFKGGHAIPSDAPTALWKFFSSF